MQAINTKIHSTIPEGEEEMPRIEVMALAFYEKVQEKDLVKDRKHNLRTYPNVLVGSDAVSVLVEVLKDGGYQKVSREDAAQLGRDINAEFGLLAHVTNDHLLKDERLFYRFQGNLPSQVRQNREGKSLWDIMDLFENAVDTQDRVYHFRTYQQCFVGRDAVDVILKLKLAVRREDAVSLMLEANRECQAFEHVCRDHDFADQYFFYRFIPRRQRLLNPQNGGQTFAAMLDALQRGSNPDDSFSMDGSLHGSSSELTISSNEGGALGKSGSFRWGSSSRRDSSGSSLDYSTALGLLPPNTTLQNIADALERDLVIKDHRYRLTTYKNCFVAKDAVTYMVKAGWASSRGRAELIGRQLQAHLNLFNHVTNGHKFRDKFYFFRFTPMEERTAEPRLSVGTSSDKSTKDDTVMPPALPRRQSLRGRVPSTKVSVVLNLDEHQTNLQDIATAFERGMKVKDNVFHLHAYERSFTGPQVVKFLMKKGFAETRQDAVLLGRLLMEEFFLFEHVGGLVNELRDCSCTLYQFVPAEERMARLELKQQRQAALEKAAEEQKKDELSAMIEGDETGAAPAPLEEQQLSLSTTDPELLEIAAVFRQGVKVRHNRYRGKIYRNTFIGSEAVNFLVNSSVATSRKEAIQLGRRLMHDLQLFDHVSRHHNFSDDYLFYRFEEHRTQSQGQHQSSISSLVQQVVQDSFSSLSNIGSIRHGFKDGSNVTPIQSGDMSGETDFLPLEQIAREFRRNVQVKDRRYRFSTYKDVFVGSDAVDYLVGNTKWASSRSEAEQLGRTLMRELDLFHHVTKAHSFLDQELFYRFTDEDEDAMLQRLEAELDESEKPFSDQAMKPEWLVEVARSLEEEVQPSCHRYRLRVYNDTIVGSEIVTFLVESGMATTRGEALQLGRAVAKQFRLFEHVTLDHMLKDANLFYRFVPRQSRGRGKWLETTYGCALRTKMSKVSTTRKHLSVKEYWDLVHEAVEKDVWDVHGSVMDQSIPSFKIVSDDSEWTRRVRNFEIQVCRKSTESRLSGISVRSGSSFDGADRYYRIKSWSSTFIRLDPRQQIHRFYNEVAQTGLTAMEEDGDSSERQSVRAITLKDLRPLMRFLPMNLASVFSVWRPTSFDAIRKMMLGDAVGKGLDIKGKSAKRGKLSGFVPFLQISNNKHKSKVRRLSPNHMVRVFYKSDCRRARDVAIAEMEKVLMEMIDMVKEAKTILASDRVDKQMYENALEVMLLDVADPSITPIDDYAPESWGIELPERLFWEAFFVRQDCTRKEGSIYDCGRPSQPAFQDMNFSALRSTPHEGAPLPVVYQNADRDDPLNPFEMLMAYEENGRVRPVVSDFDCFLVGTRRVEYNMPLPPDQLQVLKWCVQQIERICEEIIEEIKSGVKEMRPWSMLWLEVLKESTFHPEIPRFGFGDPVSYSIVENAVDRLEQSGAVRHGAECFNYYFPQDLDDEFLVVSQGVGEGNVPWKYVCVDELQDILAEKIDKGFCFPLNPKWILMDPGWMVLYKKLLNSPHKHVQEAMDIWFPPESGLRDDIERIYRLQKEHRKMSGDGERSYQELSQSMKEEILYFT